MLTVMSTQPNVRRMSVEWSPGARWPKVITVAERLGYVGDVAPRLALFRQILAGELWINACLALLTEQ